MADFVANLGEAFVTAMDANDSAFPLGQTGSTLHAEYGDQPKDYNVGATGRCYIRFERMEIIQQFEASARVRLSYLATFHLRDVQGKDGAVSLVNNGLSTVFVNHGRTFLETYFTSTDLGSNRLARGGRVDFEVQAKPFDQNDNADNPEVTATLAFEGWVNWPLA